MLLLALAWFPPARAAPPAGIHRSLTTEDGLPQNWIRALAQSPDGHLWIGSTSGLARFDGREVVRVAEEPLGQQVIRSLAVHDGTLWIAAGRALFALRDGTVRPHPVPISLTEPTLHTDTDGDLWLVSLAGILRWEKDRWQTVPAPEGCRVRAAGPSALASCDGILYALQDGAVRPLQAADGAPLAGLIALRDRNGVLWVGQEQQLQRHITRPDGRVEPLGAPLPTPPWTAMLEAGDGALWLADRERGLLGWEEDGLVPRLRLPYPSRVLFEDRDGGLWAGTEGAGLLQVGAAGAFTPLTAPLPDEMVWCILRDRHQTTWVGTNRGLVRILPDGTAKVLGPADGLPEDSILSLAEDDGGLWVGTGRSGLLRSSDAGFSAIPSDADHPGIRGSILRDSHGRVWVGGIRQLFRLEDGRLQTFPLTLSEDYPYISEIIEHSGRVWVATNRGLVSIGPDDTTETLTAADGLPDDHIRGIMADGDALWVTFRGGGLARIRDGVVRAVTDGLPATGLHAMTVDREGFAWMSSNQGAFRAPLAALHAAADGSTDPIPMASFGQPDGLLSVEFNSGYPGVQHAEDGALWFPTVRGIARWAPGRDVPPASPPVPLISTLEADHEPVPLSGSVTLPPGTRAVSVTYGAPSLLDPGGIRYRYRLEGHDDDWINAGSRQQVAYTNLSPGVYTFRLQAVNSDGVWSEQDATVAVRIQPRWSETRWFRGLLALLLVGLGIGGWRYRLRILREQELRMLVDQKTAHLEKERQRTAAQAATLAEQADALRSLHEARTRFFANISHELRTPLTLILGPAETLLSRPRPAPEAEQIHRAAGRLKRQIDALLDLARLEADQLPIQAAPADLATHLRSRCEALRPLAAADRITVTLDADPVVVWVDPMRIQQVIDNLLTNAIRHTPPGGRVQLELSADATHATLTVTDSGAGIPEGQDEAIFTRFFQAGARTGSVGLGLALCRELVERHGGTITASNAAGSGAVFTVRLLLGGDHLPAADRRPTPPPPEAAAVSPSDTAILIVEDDKDLRAWLRGVLSERFVISEAARGDDGLRLACEQVPDLLITDVMMPGMDGLSLCRAIREDPRTSHLLVLMLSARAAPDSRSAGLEQGADAYLTKPVSPRELQARIDALLSSRRRQQAHLRRTLLTEPEPDTAPSDDAVFLQRVRSRILDNLSDPDFGVAELARAVGFSRRQLGRKLLALTAQAPSVLIRTLRLQHARSLLEQGRGNVSEVADAVGFRRADRFAARFREAFGCAPSEILQKRDRDDL